MVTQRSAVEPVFAAVADPTRRAILALVRGRELSAGEVAGCFAVSRPAISRHLRILRQAGLVHERRDSRLRLYSLAPERLQVLDRWLEQYRVFWPLQLQALKQHVEARQAPSPHAKPRGWHR